MMVIVLFVLSSCSGATPQNTYAAEMRDAIKLLPEWDSDFVELGALLTQELDPTTGITRLDLIELYNMAMEYQINRDEYFRLGLSSLDALVAPSSNISKDGEAIRKILSTVTPVEEMQFDHQVLLDCVQTRVAFADELASSIRDLSAIDMERAAELIACDPFDASLEKITTFVNENK
jgi:hypothetical protein